MTSAPPPVAGAVARSAAGQVAARALHLVLNVASSLLVVRYLTPSVYGEFVLVLTVTATIGLVADLGLSKIAVRRIAEAPAVERQVLSAVLGTRLALALVAALTTQGALVLLGSGGQVRAAALVLSLLYLCEAGLSLVVVFYVRLEQQYEAVVRMVAEVIETAVLIWLIVTGQGLVALMWAPVVGLACGLALALVLVRRRLGRLPVPRSAGAGLLLREALPVGGSLLLAALYLKAGALVLAALHPGREMGLYGAAAQPVEYLLLASAVVMNIALPLLVRARAGATPLFGELYRRGTEVLLAATLPVGVCLCWLAPVLATTVFGVDFAQAGPPLRILGVALVPLVLCFWQAIVLLAGHQQRATLHYDAAAAVGQVGLCVLLVPLLGTTGPAWALLVSATLVLAVATRLVSTRLGAALDRGRLLAVLTAGTAMVAVTALVWPRGPVAALPAGLLAYGLVLRGTGMLDRRPFLAVLVPGAAPA